MYLILLIFKDTSLVGGKMFKDTVFVMKTFSAGNDEVYYKCWLPKNV